jgi:hypothetical protein
MNLTAQDGREMLVALSIAIAHETEVVSRLESDDRLCSFIDSIEDRRRQIAAFERLAKKLRKPVA